MAYTDLNAIQTALLTCSWNCLEKAWNDVESDCQDLSRLFQSPERNVEAVTQGLQRWKGHARLLSWNLTVHSLMLHTDIHSRRFLSAVVTCWKTVQLLLVQLEKVLVNKKEKNAEDALWLQIQGLVGKLGVLLLKNFKKEQCGVDDFTPGKKGPDNDPRPGDSSKKGGKMTKIRHYYKATKPLKRPVKELQAKRRNLHKLTIKIPKSSSDTFNFFDQNCTDKMQLSSSDKENKSVIL